MSTSEDFIQEIKDRVRLSELISERVELKLAGRRHTGLCPFHREKTPSFSVNDEEGFYHCFGCGVHGDALSFVMETRNFTFPEALQYLANRVGLEVPQRKHGARRKDSSKESLRRQVLHQVSLAYQSYLESHPEAQLARRYLEARGIAQTVQERFHIGLAPSEQGFLWDVLSKGALKDSNEDIERILFEVGLLKRGQEGSHYLSFKDRLVFPIARSDGATLGFGGRVYREGDSRPKYLNSPETLLYKKSRALYGVFQALPRVRKTRQVYVVEGYLDVVSMAQVGLEQVIATCGTALTDEHVNILKRVSDRVTLLFDGDEAGRKAAAQSLPKFLGSGLDVSAVLLPDGEDPDSLSQKMDEVQLLKFLQSKEEPLMKIYFDWQLREGSGSGARGRVAKHFIQQLSAVNNPVEKELHLVQAAECLGVSVEALGQLEPSLRISGEFRRARKRSSSPSSVTPKREVSLINEFIKHLVTAVMVDPSLARNILDSDSFQSVSKLPEEVVRLLEEFGDKNPSPLTLASPESEEHLAELLIRHGFDSSALIQHAKDLLRIGGSEPIRLVAEAGAIVERSSLRSAVQKLKQGETKAHTESELLEIAQRKLLKRRDMEEITDT